MLMREGNGNTTFVGPLNLELTWLCSDDCKFQVVHGLITRDVD